MYPVTRIAIAGLVLLGLSPGAGATMSNKELEAQAQGLSERIAAVERANQTLVQMQQQIEAARRDLRTLRGQIDEAQHELETLRQQQRDLYADVDRRLLLIENGAQPATAGSVQASPSEAEIRAVDESSVYGEAFAAMKAGRYDEAAKGFQLYLTKYPDGPRADNATYWLGESHYVRKDYDAALRSFQAVLDKYPDSRKAADAMLKVAYCQYELKAFRNARTTLEGVVNTYPGSETARLAEQRLTKLDAEGR